jgi:transposase
MSRGHKDVLAHSHDRAQLEHWVRSATAPQRLVWRSRIALLGLDGLPESQIAARVGVSEPTVRLWLRRFAADGAVGLTHDAPGRGRHATIDPETMISRLRAAQLLAVEDQPRSISEAAKYLGVSVSTVRRALHKRRLQR